MEKRAENWCLRRNTNLIAASAISIRYFLNKLLEHLSQNDDRPMIHLGHGDPSVYPCFRTSATAENAIVEAVLSAEFNHYSTSVGILPARRAVANHLSCDLPYQLSPDEVFLCVGATQAIEIIISVLACPGANILLPRPGYPVYEARAAYSHLEVRHFDLIPEKGWEVDIDSVEALADENTVAILMVNPGNPCGNVYTYQHLKKVAETARKLGICVIADEVYGHLVFGSNPFVPMGVFGSIAPVVTLGSISKRWIVPGWRFGWIAACDPNGILTKFGILDGIRSYFDLSSNPATFTQGAIPHILEKTSEGFFSNIIEILRETSETCYRKIQEIPCITCPTKAEGSMTVMAKLNVSLLEDIEDDMDFCVKLMKEESVVLLPGVAVGMKNWMRVTFAVEPPLLEEGLGRIKAFCQRHAKETLSHSFL